VEERAIASDDGDCGEIVCWDGSERAVASEAAGEDIVLVARTLNKQR